jgi:hypothetical protein
VSLVPLRTAAVNWRIVKIVGAVVDLNPEHHTQVNKFNFKGSACWG